MCWSQAAPVKVGSQALKSLLARKAPQDPRAGAKPSKSSVDRRFGWSNSRKVIWTTSPPSAARWRVVQTLALITPPGRSCGRKKNGRQRLIEIAKRAGVHKIVRPLGYQGVIRRPHRQHPPACNHRAVHSRVGPALCVSFVRTTSCRTCSAASVRSLAKEKLYAGVSDARIALIDARDVWRCLGRRGGGPISSTGWPWNSRVRRVSDTARWLRKSAKAYWTDGEVRGGTPGGCGRGGTRIRPGRLDRTGHWGLLASLLQRFFGDFVTDSLQSLTGHAPRGHRDLCQGKSWAPNSKLDGVRPDESA